MKNKVTGSLMAGLMMAVILTGCGGSGNTPQGSQAEPEAAQEESTDNSDPAKEAEEAGAYDPAGFKVSDVYVAPDQTPSVDISGCDTFTQIVDKLNEGKGYANITLGEEDVLLISSGTYEWDDGKPVAIDADIFCYKDGVPTYLATVSAGGTAYPLALKDGNLYVGGNHFINM